MSYKWGFLIVSLTIDADDYNSGMYLWQRVGKHEWLTR